MNAPDVVALGFAELCVSTDAIEDVETQLAAANETLSAPETASDYEQILHWTAVIDDLHAQQTVLMEQWEALATERETLA